MKVLSVVGNRPQFIKSGPVSAALREVGIEEVGLHTGQHWDPELSAVFYAELGLPEPRYHLDLHTADSETMRPAIAAALAQEQPDWALAFGVTNSTRAGTEAAGDAGVPGAGVEAGGCGGGLSLPDGHNPSAVGGAAAPVGYLDMAALVSQARGLVTDSGGLQKEAYWYGVPCVTARPSTEWIDTVELGANVLVDDDPKKLAAAVASARMPNERPPLYGDGHAAERVAASLADRG